MGRLSDLASGIRFFSLCSLLSLRFIFLAPEEYAPEKNSQKKARRDTRRILAPVSGNASPKNQSRLTSAATGPPLPRIFPELNVPVGQIKKVSPAIMVLKSQVHLHERTPLGPLRFSN